MTIFECETVPLPPSVEKAIARLAGCGLFEYGLIGGSWCFPFYDTIIGIKYNFRTLDLDFMVDGALQHRKKIIRDLEAELEDEGFISTIDYATHLQKFHTADMEVEFLTPRKGNQGKTVLIRPFNITAQPLPFLNILFSEPLALKVTSLDGIVRVPSPRSMLLHKMIIAHRRTKESKKSKDLDQCKVLSLYCSRTEVQELVNQQKFGRNTWKSITASCEIIGIDPPFAQKVRLFPSVSQGTSRLLRNQVIPKKETPMSASDHPFHRLTPAFVMDAVESRGYRCDCRTLALNSYENRVYQVGIEEGQPLIAKFYRPGRWSDAQIIEEHEFSTELAEHDLPVVAPLADEENRTLSHFDGFRFTLYPRKGGHAPEFDNLDNLLIMGRLLGRMHRIGALRPFEHRPQLSSADFGHAAAEWIGEHFIPGEYRDNYCALTHDLLQGIDQLMTEVTPRVIRTHGDCHAGNVLWRDDAPHLVDLDDARMAPAVQDIWMMLSGERPRQLAQLSEIVEGYNEFHSFNPTELRLIEALRSLRIIHHSAWLAHRWKDPAFPTAFPWFNTPRFWDGHILELREQIAALREPPLQLA